MKRTMGVFGCLIASLALMACTQPSLELISSDSLVYCSESPPDGFNPQLNTDSTTADVSSHQIYSRLIDFESKSGKVIPALASSWSVSDDGLTYTFQLRKDIEFHNTAYFTPTRTFNADDVLFSFNRWRLENHPFHYVSGGRYPYFQSLQLADYIRAINKINKYRIEIILKQRDSSFLANLASDFSVILSAEYAQQLLQNESLENIDHLPVGTGPFMYQNYKKGDVIYLKKHDKYWQNTAQVSHLIYDITPQSALRLAKLATGECDVMSLPSQSELDVVREKPNLILEQSSALNVGYWAFNVTKPPFDNPKVRKALSLAIDKNALLDTVYLGNATRAKTLVPPASWAFDVDADDIKFNPVLARKMLDDEGIKPGFSMTIWAHPLVRDYNPNAYKMAELIKQYLAAVDVSAKIVSTEWNTFRSQLSEGLHDSVLIGWSADNGDPDNFFRPLLTCDAIPSGTNRAKWCYPEYDELVYKALQTDDMAQRKLIYQQINALLHDQLPLVPIAHSLTYQAYRDDIQGLTVNPFGAIRFGGVSKTR
jgi:cationic peptide transport system substrate-binding protein